MELTFGAALGALIIAAACQPTTALDQTANSTETVTATTPLNPDKDIIRAHLTYLASDDP